MYWLEEAVAVAHAVAVAGDALVGHGVKEAGGETAEATVAEARVGLLAADGLEVGAHRRAHRQPRGRGPQG